MQDISRSTKQKQTAIYHEIDKKRENTFYLKIKTPLLIVIGIILVIALSLAILIILNMAGYKTGIEAVIPSVVAP